MAELLCALGNLVNLCGAVLCLITSLVTRANGVAVDIIAIGRRTRGTLVMVPLVMLLLWGVVLVMLLLSLISALWGILSMVVAALLMVLRRWLVIPSSVALIVMGLRVVLALSRVRVAIASLLVVLLLLSIPLRRGRLMVSPTTTGAVALSRVSVRHGEDQSVMIDEGGIRRDGKERSGEKTKRNWERLLLCRSNVQMKMKKSMCCSFFLLQLPVSHTPSWNYNGVPETARHPACTRSLGFAGCLPTAAIPAIRTAPNPTKSL